FLVPSSLLVIIGTAIFILATSQALPERVASHFVRGGQANGWMPRDAYVAFSLAAGVLVPFILVAMVAWLPRVFPRAVNLPNRTYWFEPERRDATLASLSAFAWGFAAVITLLVGGLHWLVVQANTSSPPILAET